MTLLELQTLLKSKGRSFGIITKEGDVMGLWCYASPIISEGQLTELKGLVPPEFDVQYLPNDGEIRITNKPK